MTRRLRTENGRCGLGGATGSSTGNSNTCAGLSACGCSAYSSHEGDVSTSDFASAAAEDDDRKSDTLLLLIAVATGRKADRARRNERTTVEAFLAANMVVDGVGGPSEDA